MTIAVSKYIAPTDHTGARIMVWVPSAYEFEALEYGFDHSATDPHEAAIIEAFGDHESITRIGTAGEWDVNSVLWEIR